MKTIFYVFLAAMFLAAAAGADEQAAEIHFSMEESIALISVGDIIGLLEETGGLMSQLMPGMDGDNLKAMLGEAIGDPQLAGIRPGGSLAAAVFPDGRVSGGIEVAPEHAGEYADLIRELGIKTEQVGDIVVWGSNDESLRLALLLSDDIKDSLASAGPEAEIDVKVNSQAAIKNFGEELDQTITMLPMMMSGALEGEEDVEIQDTQDFMNHMEAGMRLIKVSFSQIETLNYVISPGAEGLRFEYKDYPMPGTAYQEYLNIPIAFPGTYLAFLPGRGAVRGGMGFNQEAYSSMMGAFLEEVFSEMDLTGEQKEKIKSQFGINQHYAGDGFAFDLYAPGAYMMNGAVVAGAEDPDAVLREAESGMEMMNRSFSGLCREEGKGEISFRLRKNAREHAGVMIHEIYVETPEDEVSYETEVLEILSNHKCEFAFSQGMVLYAFGEQKIEELVDASLSGGHPEGLALRSQSALAVAEASGYFDVRVDMLADFMSELMSRGEERMPEGAQTLKAVMGMLEGAPPVKVAVSSEPRHFGVTALIPAELMARVIQAFMFAAMMQ